MTVEHFLYHWNLWDGESVSRKESDFLVRNVEKRFLFEIKLNSEYI